uniref:Gustatory receptor n=2 Tax=Bombyx mori TaxID=7091 RepID=B7FF34_BOMMO|nr:TPA_inf: gustatory receptor 18 [Bombyx mori]
MRRSTKVISMVNQSDKGEIKTCSRFMKIYFFVIYILTGFNFGFYTGRGLNFLRVIQASVLLLRFIIASNCIYIAFHFRLLEAIWYSLTFSESLAIVVCFMLSRSALSCKNLFEYLYSVDQELKKSVGPSIEVKLALYTVVVSVLRLTVYVFCAIAYYETLHEGFCVELVYNTPCYCSDLYLVIHFTIFHSVYCRLKALRISMNEKFDVYKGTLIYKSLIDNLEEIKKSLDVPFFVILLNAVAIAMINILVTLEISYGQTMKFIRTAPRYLETVLLFSSAFAPVLAADMMASEAQKIKVTLNNILQRDDSLLEDDRRKVKQFAGYVSARPFRLRACRVLSLDCTLPVTVLSICVTYLIVVVQFTHLY